MVSSCSRAHAQARLPLEQRLGIERGRGHGVVDVMCDAARHLPERPQALLTVLQLENKAGQIKDVAYDLRDTTVVDLTDWQSHWSFASTPGFMVQSIRGTALLPQAG